MLGGFKCIWECWLFVVFVVWGRRKIVCFVDLCDVNVETVYMLYRTGVLLYQVLIIRYLPMSTKHDREVKLVKRHFEHHLQQSRSIVVSGGKKSLIEQTQLHQFERFFLNNIYSTFTPCTKTRPMKKML